MTLENIPVITAAEFVEILDSPVDAQAEADYLVKDNPILGIIISRWINMHPLATTDDQFSFSLMLLHTIDTAIELKKEALDGPEL